MTSLLVPVNGSHCQVCARTYLDGVAAEGLVHAAHNDVLVDPLHAAGLGAQGHLVLGGPPPSFDGVDAGVSGGHGDLVLHIVEAGRPQEDRDSRNTQLKWGYYMHTCTCVKHVVMEEV